MADEKKNPLIGAFRNEEPPPPKLAQSPGSASPVQSKAVETKTSNEPVKTVPTGTVTPGKPAEDKTPTEPPKTPADGKAAPTDTATPGKSAEEKKPIEQPKPPADSKAAPTDTAAPHKPAEPPKTPADGKAAPADTATLGKPAEEKKPTEPPKTPADGKAAPAGTVTPGKPAEDKTPTEPPKTPADSKAAPTDTAAPHKPAEEKKPAEPPKTPADGKAAPADTATPGKPADEKKPAEPPKTPTDGKATPPADTATPSKPIEPPKTPADGKAAPADTATPGKPTEEKKPTKPPETQADGKAAPTDTAASGKPTEELELPKNLKIPLAPTEGGEIVTRLKLDEVQAFEGHPYSVKEDKDMWDLVDSVKQFGVLEPAMVIPREAGGYELVSGHRRHRACQLAGLTEIPVIIRNLDRDEAIISMVDANLKRENISPMEKARAYDMKLSAMQRKAGRRSKMDILTGEKPKMAVEELAAQTGESAATIKRIRSLVKLEPDLQEMVEKKVLPVNTAADIAQLKPDEQKKLADAIQREDKVPSGSQAAALKEASKAGTLTPDKIEQVVAPTKKETDPELKVTFNNDELRSYFPDKHTTVGDVKRVVFEALTLRTRALERQAKKEAEKNTPPPKTQQKQR